MNRFLVGTCAYNEGQKILNVIERFNDYAHYDVVVIDDGSSDGALNDVANNDHLTVIRNKLNLGAGYCVRMILHLAKEKDYEAVLFVSGNNKDDPQDIPKITDALNEDYDFVQGSRYLPGGAFGGDMPLYRKFATKLYPLIFSLLTGKRITDSTNGFRGIHLSMLDDEEINIDQPWLDQYELEPYLFYKAVTLGYKVKEVPVKKIYPKKSHGYTKMKPFSGWWSILRPIIYLSLGLKK